MSLDQLIAEWQQKPRQHRQTVQARIKESMVKDGPFSVCAEDARAFWDEREDTYLTAVRILEALGTTGADR